MMDCEGVGSMKPLRSERRTARTATLAQTVSILGLLEHRWGTAPSNTSGRLVSMANDEGRVVLSKGAGAS